MWGREGDGGIERDRKGQEKLQGGGTWRIGYGDMKVLGRRRKKCWGGGLGGWRWGGGGAGETNGGIAREITEVEEHEE